MLGIESQNHQYNCWASCIDISQNDTPNFDRNYVERFEFKDEILEKYEDVTDTPSQYKFGHTVIRFAETEWNIRHGSYSVTTHGATYLGTSQNGTQYTWSKNGRGKALGVFTVGQLNQKYGKVEGYRAEPGGGFYNLR